MLKFVCTVSLASAIISAGTVKAEEPDQIVFQGAGWTVAAMRTQGTFLGCYASKDFQSGTRWVFARYRNDQWKGLIGEHGGRADNVGHVELAVDGNPIHVVNVLPNANHLGRLGQLTDQAIKELADGRVLELANANGTFQFSLSGSEDALNKTLECVDYFEAQERGEGEAPEPRQQRPDAHQTDVAYVPPDEATRLLTAILDDAKTTAYRIDSPKQGSAVITFNFADGTIGAFVAARGRETKDAESYASGVIAKWASNCGGDFLSGKQPVPSTNGSVIRKVTTTCRDKASNYVTETVVVRQQNGFLIELAQTYPANAELPKGETSRKRGALMDAVMRLP